jgi:hypothetical protein
LCCVVLCCVVLCCVVLCCVVCGCVRACSSGLKIVTMFNMNGSVSLKFQKYPFSKKVN